MNAKTMMNTHSKYRRSQYWWGYIFVFPTILGMFILNVIPEIQTILYSFTEVKGIKRDKVSWVGLENFIDMAKDPVFWQAFKNVFVFAIITVPITVSLSVLLGYLLNQKIRGRSLYRTISFIPVVVPPVALGLVWVMLFEPVFGLINSTLGKEIYWLTNSNLAMLCIIFVTVWSSIGYYALLVLAGLQTVPSLYREAALIDGANPVQIFFKITLPLLSPTIFLITVLNTISSMQLFDLAVVMIRKNNPAYPDVKPVLEFFYQNLLSGKYGDASVAIVLLLLIIGGITILQFKVQKRLVHYG